MLFIQKAALHIKFKILMHSQNGQDKLSERILVLSAASF